MPCALSTVNVAVDTQLKEMMNDGMANGTMLGTPSCSNGRGRRSLSICNGRVVAALLASSDVRTILCGHPLSFGGGCSPKLHDGCSLRGVDIPMIGRLVRAV
jgi:hypothetical protein